MFRKIYSIGLIIGLIAIAVSLGGCAREYFCTSSYFDGAVVVEYRQTTRGGHNDYVTFRFYEENTYQIAFSVPKYHNRKHLPHDFTKVIADAPREVVIEQYVLPGVLRIRITRDSETAPNGYEVESHDFS